MPSIIDWSPALRFSDRSDPALAFATRSSGPSIGGTRQVLSALSAIWRWRVSVPVYDQVTGRSVRLMRSRLKGDFNFVRIRLCDAYGITHRQATGSSGVIVPHSDGAYFSDGSGYAAAWPTSRVQFDAAATDTSITINALPLGDAISAGVFFSINDWLYQIDNFEKVANTYVLTISPPLREAVDAGDDADFSGRSIWRLVDADQGDLALSGSKFGVAQFSFEEPAERGL